MIDVETVYTKHEQSIEKMYRADGRKGREWGRLSLRFVLKNKGYHCHKHYLEYQEYDYGYEFSIQREWYGGDDGYVNDEYIGICTDGVYDEWVV